MDLDWPPGLTVMQAQKYAAYYLNKSGWLVQKDQPQGARFIVAWKRDICLMLCIAEPDAGILQTQMRDIDETAYNSSRSVMVVVYDLPRRSFMHLQISSRLFLAEPKDIADAEGLMRKHLGALAAAKLELEGRSEGRT
jgi:hypothetical protein